MPVLCTVCVVEQFFILKQLSGKSKWTTLITEFTHLGKLSSTHLVQEGMASRKFQLLSSATAEFQLQNSKAKYSIC